ncbi:MAG: RNA polymerase sigma factor [Candidatus Promineifilaceae bacterium]
MKQRTNDEWLSELRDPNNREDALIDLRTILLNGLRRGLVSHVNTQGPEFEPLAEDFTQEALLKVLANIDSFRGKSKFTTWAHKIAVRVALTELRRKRWKDRSLDDLLSDDSPVTFVAPDKKPTPDMTAVQTDLMARVMRIIQEELTDKQRTAMQLVPIGGTPIDVAARQMSMKRNALYKLLHDARLRVKNRLQKEGLSSAEILAAFS